jgi:hypothetical protein
MVIDIVGTDDDGSFSPVPAGKYNVTVKSAELKQSKSGIDMFSLGYVISEGQYKGRYIWDNVLLVTHFQPSKKYNWKLPRWAKIVEHPLPELAEGKKGKWSVPEIKDLLGKQFCVKVNIQEDKSGEYEPRNNVQDYLAWQENLNLETEEDALDIEL